MNKWFLLLSLFFLTGCYRVEDKIEPKVRYQVQEQYIQNLTSPFKPLAFTERKQDWGKEYVIALAFAEEFDLYRAVSTFKRAEVLVPPEHEERKVEIQYNILLSYYLGQKYQSVIQTFNRTELPHVDPSFPAFHDLLVILFESYTELNIQEKAEKVLLVLEKNFPKTAEKLKLSHALLQANTDEAKKIAQENHLVNLETVLTNYDIEKKSVRTAQWLNVILPGTGYFYVDQYRTGITAMLINGLFIAAAYEFFHRGYTAAGIVTTSFEMGWYFGGIYGAGEAAKYYNERLYEENVSYVMGQNKLYPIFSLQYAF